MRATCHLACAVIRSNNGNARISSQREFIYQTTGGFFGGPKPQTTALVFGWGWEKGSRTQKRFVLSINLSSIAANRAYSGRRRIDWRYKTVYRSEDFIVQGASFFFAAADPCCQSAYLTTILLYNCTAHAHTHTHTNCRLMVKNILPF